MSSIILSFPFSGALYSYFSDQLDEYKSGNRMWHPYYKTLYGNDPTAHLELALTFMLLYDEVWMAPADNHWPRSRLNPEDQSHIVELGLHADWKDFLPADHKEYDEYVNFLCAQQPIVELLGRKFKVPPGKWKQLIDYALYDASMSARKRIPILCSRGRRALISALVQIQAPTLHPLFTPESEVTFVETYNSIMGLALTPRTLDHLMDAKPDRTVRGYGKAFVGAASAANSLSPVDQRSLARAALEAIETERVAGLFSGILNWAATFLRLTHQPVLAAGAKGASFLASAGASEAGWYEFKGSIDHAIGRAETIRKLTLAATAPDA